MIYRKKLDLYLPTLLSIPTQVLIITLLVAPPLRLPPLYLSGTSPQAGEELGLRGV